MQRVAKFQESAPKIEMKGKKKPTTRWRRLWQDRQRLDSDRRFNTGVRIIAFNFEIIEPVVKKANRVYA
ncbi:hypothetical protein LFZ31_26670 [Salmonella enterica subsp. enterica serovar Newport str. S09097]|nr:hypothetical protein LFZ31_26670 [Salmonella enterica subsp. enterica serovar Newport str. S09097]